MAPFLLVWPAWRALTRRTENGWGDLAKDLLGRSDLLYEPVQHLEELIQLLSLRRQLFGRWRERELVTVRLF